LTYEEGFAGGGSLPEEAIPSVQLAIRPQGLTPEALAARLRRQVPPVIGRIAAGRVLLDLLAVGDDEVPLLAASVRAALA
jgi:L-seryl-tRNA(Ser) seleniumtransferase